MSKLLTVLLVGVGVALVAWLLITPRPEHAERGAPQAPSESQAPSAPQPDEQPNSGERRSVNPQPSDAARRSPDALPAPERDSPFPRELAYDGPTRDRTRADALREALVALHAGKLAAQAEEEPAHGVMPEAEGSGNQADKPAGKYVAQVMREQFLPLAGSCYEALIEQQPNAAGDVVLEFSIMGDRAVGGVVVDVELGEGTTLRAPSFETCVRESMFAVIFDAPPQGVDAAVSVTQSFTFEP